MRLRKKLNASRLARFVALIWTAAQLPAIASADPKPAAVATNEISQMDLAQNEAGAIEPPSLVNPPILASNPVPPPPPITPSQNVTINLINRLVQRGALTKEDAAELIRMAENDAEVARAQAASAQQTAAAAEVRASAAQAAVAQIAAVPTAPAQADDEDVRVTYVPEIVKQQLRDEIRQEVMSQAREENWAAPRTFPTWVSRFSLFGDVRARYEGDFFPSGNDNTGAFPNFNAINTGPPFDVTGTQFSPQLNVDQDRERFRLRVRFGVAVDLAEGFSAGLRLATGENNSPVTTNQSLGLANQGQGGNFSKYAIWLDRGFLKYQAGGELGNNFSVSVGRFDNPFFGVSEIIWDDDLGFDGIALQGKYEVTQGVKAFVNAGAFPVFNTDFNFSSNRPDKFASDDKYLFGGQLGADWKLHKEWSLKLAGAYYYFDNVEGRLSSPFTPLTAADAGDTDNTRPSFAQKGNTYFPIRDIVPTVDNNFGTTRQFQYFGLATPFQNVAATGRLDFNHFDPVHIALFGEFVKNVAFDGSKVEQRAINNRGPDMADGSPGNFEGGDTAWLVGVRVGHAALEKRWDWHATLGYRSVETDAVIDGFNDSDFGLGGTNLKGYTISGSLAVAARVALTLRWLSADSITGPTYKNDIIQFDVNAKF